MMLDDQEMRVLLGFDFGLKHIGVAVGQVITRTARPLLALPAKEGIPAWDKLTALIHKWQPQALVVGIPLHMDGSEQPLTAAARHFGQSLQQFYHLPIFEIDERLTTVDARERLFTAGGYRALQKDKIDSLAAQLILQNWLNTHA